MCFGFFFWVFGCDRLIVFFWKHYYSCAGSAPGRPSKENKDDSLKESDSLFEAVKASKSVVVAGGGGKIRKKKIVM
jgi:hypothetical protein